MTLVSGVDHLVVAAATLEQGAAWCESIFGIAPGPGGRHALMGTHNLVFSIGSARHPRAYLEIISIDPASAVPAHRRWFDLDDPAVQRALAVRPRLVHFVASCDQATAALGALRTRCADPGDLIAAERATPHGVLQWEISIRQDGQRQFDGALPALIRWSGEHPTWHMPPSGVRLLSLQVRHPRARELQLVYEAIGLRGVAVHEGPADLVATFESPRGPVSLHSGGI